ncbi:retrovirus-related pol polyprotein from transposon TNT 1-94 [Tanacetum coccineum]
MIPQVHSPQSYSPINATPYLSQPQISHLSVSPSYQYQSHRDHQTSSVPQIAYHSHQYQFPQMYSGLVVHVFTQGDDPITYLNKAMAFLSAIAASRFPSTNNQLRTSSNPRNQATIQDGKGNATSSGGNNAGGHARVVKCYNCQGEGHMARQCTQTKRPRNVAWFKDKAMLAEAQQSGQILDEEQLEFLIDPGIPDGQDVISEVPHSEPYHNDMDNQSVHAMQDFKQTPVVDFLDNEITSDSNIILYSQYLQETQQAAVQDTNLYAQQDSMILSKAQRIKPTLYDGSVISSQHAVIPVIDDKETWILEECMTRSSTKELLLPFKNPEQKFHSKRRLFDTPSLIESNSSEFDHIFNIKEQSKEKVRETMTETMEQYLSKTRGDYSGSEHEDANKHIEKVLEIIDLFHIPKVTQDQIMLRAFLVSLTGAASRWLRNQPSGSITTWEEVILFYNGLDVPTRQILDSTGAIPSKTTADAKIAIKEMAKYSQKWHNGTSSRTRSRMRTMQGTTLYKGLSTKGRRKTLEEAYYTQFGAPYQTGGQYRAAGPGFYQRNNGNSSYPNRRPSLEESLTKFMAKSAKRNEENSNIIKEIRASTDAAIRNQRALIKTLEIQIG